MRRLLTYSMFVATCGVAPAQDIGRFLPERPLGVVRFKAPAALSERFGDTNLGQLFQSPMFAGLSSALEAAAEAEADDDVSRLYEIAAAYTGTVIVGFDFEIPEDEDDDEPRFQIVLKFGPAEGTDLDEVARLAGSVLERYSEAELVDQDVGEQSFRVAGDSTGGLTVPRVIGSELVAFAIASPSFEAELERLISREADDNLSFGETFERGDIAARVEVRGLAEIFVELLEREVMFAGMGEQIVGLLGLDAIRSAELGVTPADEHVVFDMAMGWDADQPWSFGEIMRPEQDGPSPLLAYVPRTAPNWSVTAMDMGRLFDFILELMGGMLGDGQVAMMEEAVEEQLGLRLKEDLFDHMGTDFLQLSSGSGGDAAAADPTDDFDGMCLGVSLRNAEAFAKSIDELVRSQGLAGMREQSDYRGLQLNVVDYFGLEVFYAIPGDLAVIGLGESGGKNLRAVLDEVVARRAGEDVAEWGDAIKSRLEHGSAGWQGVSVSVLSDSLAMFAELAEEQDLVPPEVAGMVPTLRGLLDQFELQTMVTTSRVTRTGIQSRMIW